MKELYERTPFREKLRRLPNGNNSILFTPENSEYIVRPEIQGGAPPVDDLKIARSLHAELEMNCGIAVPRCDIVLGPTPIEGANAAYLVVDKVAGVGLEVADIDDETIRTFVSSLLKYHIDKYQNGGYFLSDIGINQYLFGSAPGKSDRRIYLVDIDPFYGYVDNLNRQNRNDDFFTNLEIFNELMGVLEKSKGVNLSHLRQKFEEFLKMAKPKAHPADQKTVDRILQSIMFGKPTEDMEVG
ncbi:MAG: hypothetical protein A3H50_03335 [Candidatus Levybacteria bacterium RIFCSPLOWO2_02_FULL_37_10]|nr:MAG: hypothetical protein A2860_03065 [Candidatus Levybacteria bacterium RIFCSPHIGHO2_01_FULL_37_33]OGH43625.1 MAG: hypothetical protein A3H50_03335 [Candidatus Levybacteria bacterium RIFCSPLOWO2_02_FULL_37_10]